MKYVAGILIGFGISSLIWTAAMEGKNGWVFCVIAGLAMMIVAEAAQHNGHS